MREKMKKGTKHVCICLLFMILAAVTFNTKYVKAAQNVTSVRTAESLVLQKGKKQMLHYQITSKAAAKVSFKSKNPKVVTVSKNGVLKAKKAGKATITVKAGKKKATVKITVKNKIKAVRKVKLNKKKVSLNVGQQEKLTASVTPKKATSKKNYWISSNPSVAGVDKKGMVTAKASGTATITAYAADSSNKKARCKITVTENSNLPQQQVSPEVKITGKIEGSAYTNGKSTLKYALNTKVDYEKDSAVVFSLTMPDGSKIDDSKIDSSQAKVTLVDGEGYYPSEYQFLATKLGNAWRNGKQEYRLKQGDLELDLSQYPNVDSNSGREWSCLGGDGHGNYTFNLEVSGIRYNGKELAKQNFQIHIYIYGYNYTSDAANLYTEDGTPAITPKFQKLSERTEVPEVKDNPVWVWLGDGEKPILCDHLADDFYVIWPESLDASGLKSSDVHITLRSESGSTKTLTPEKDYKISTEKGETQIAVTYQNWAFVPVYSKMDIAVTNGKINTEETYDIASVYVYETQQGGGGTTIDGTVTAYSFYGLENLTDWKQIMGSPKYLLTCEKDGEKVYYAEDTEGKGKLTTDAAEAMQYDAVEEKNPKLINNTVYITTRTNLKTIEKTVNGEKVVFEQYYPGWSDPVDAGGSLLSPKKSDTGLKAAAGYVIPWNTENWITNEKWAWQKGVEEGWTGIIVSPYKGKYEWEVAKGSSQKFDASLNDQTVPVNWEIVGDVAAGTTVTQDGTVTVAENETQKQFAVTVTAKDGTKGTVTIKIK